MERYTTWKWSSKASLLAGGRDSSLYYYCKRTMDMVVATLALLLLLPVFLLIAILIRLDSAGPVFFVQERVGARRRSKHGRTVWKIENFRVYKFRSMVQDADPTAHQAYIKAFVNGSVEASDEGGPKFKLSNDPRVTRVGHILRKTSLDELPQLVNVLKGEMSLVGPRPLPTYEVAEYQAWHRERLAALPGITGLWQVQGRCDVTFEEQVQMDIEYVRNQSLWQDIRILMSTIPAVVSGRGAE